MTSPKVLTEDWITTLDREKRIPWNPAGQADAEDLPHGLGVEPHLLEIQVQRAGILHHARSTREAEMHWEITVAMATPATSSLQTMTKKRFSTMLTTPAREEEVQRPLGIALRPQQGGAEVVDHGGRHAQEVDPQIQRGQIQHVLRGLHPDQDGPGTEDAHHCQHQAADDAQQDGGVDYRWSASLSRAP